MKSTLCEECVRAMDVGVDVVGNETVWFIPWETALTPVEEMLPPDGILHVREHTQHRVQPEDTPSAIHDYADATNDIYALLCRGDALRQSGGLRRTPAVPIILTAGEHKASPLQEG